VKKNAKLKRSDIVKKGATVAITCTKDSQAEVALNLTKATAQKLGIKTKSKTTTIATARGACKQAGGAKLKLKAPTKYKRNLSRAKKTFTATLALKLTEPGGSANGAAVTVRVG